MGALCKRAYNERWGHEFLYEVLDVDGRSAILIHAVGKASQLRGCISPSYNLKITRQKECGCLSSSRKAYFDMFGQMNEIGVDKLIITDPS